MSVTKGTFFDNFQPRAEDEEEDKPIIKEVSKVEDDQEDEDDETLEQKLAKEKYGDDEDDDKSEDKEEDESDDDEPFLAIINHAEEKGLLYYDPEKEYEGNGEEILEEVIVDTLDKRWNEEYVESIPEEYQSIFKHLKAGRPLDEWVDAVKPLDYDGIDLTDEENQKQLIEDHLALTGMDDDDIKETIKEYEDLGILDKKSTVALKYLKKNENAKAKQYEAELDKELERQEVENKKSLDDLKKDILSKDELGKIKLDKSTREKLFDHITKPVNKKGESKLVVNQKDKDKQLLLAYLDMIDFNFDDLRKGVETKVTSGLRQKLSNFTDKNATKTGGKSVKEPKQSVRVPKGIWDSAVEIED